MFIAALIAGIVALASYLFLPIVSFMGYDMAFIDMIGNAGFIDYLIILAAIGVIVGAAIKNKVLALVCSIVGTVCMLASMGSLAEALGGAGVDAMDILGVGFWLALLAFIGGIIFSAVAKRRD